MIGMDERTFVGKFEAKVRNTIRRHRLLSKRDRVIVAVSGGKDSTTALYVLHKLGFNVEGMFIDQLLGKYSRNNLSKINEFCKEMEIKLHVISMEREFGCSISYMKNVLESKGIRMNTCMICGVIRRSILNRRAREVNATKVVTGHNLDDEAQTFLMNMIHGNIYLSAKLGPSTGVVKNKKFIPRDKPLYYCLEEEVERYSRIKKYPVQYEACPCARDSSRSSVRKHLNKLEELNPGTKLGIVESFLKILPALKEKYKKTGGIKYCITCGEPSSGGKCKACTIMETIKSK